MFFLYILKTASTKFKKTDVGYTNKISKRLAKKNSKKGAKSKKGHKRILIVKKTFKNKSNAMSFEYKLKKNRKERKLILEKFNK